MHYEKYQVEDFVLDRSFREWVLGADGESAAFWERWISDHPHKRKLIVEAREIVLSVETDQISFPDCKNQEMWGAVTKVMEEDSIVDHILEERVEEGKSGTSPSALPYHLIKNDPSKTNKRGSKYFRAAASVTIIVGLSFGLYQLNRPEKVAGTSEQTQYIKRENPPGIKSVITLSDGTKVSLNATSRLEFPNAFKGEKRLVYLSGEAFFEVQKDPEKPFIVITNKIATTVIGTSFNIEAFPEDAQISISLVEGKVKVEAFDDEGQYKKTAETFLTPGEQVIYKDGQALKKERFDREVVTAWKDGILNFKKADFEEIIDKLEKWYGVEFKVLNQNREDIRFSGTFQNETLKNVLEAISYSQKFTYHIEGENITIDFKH
ncbi:MAG: DUF4974 domain-containing protein [Cytophagales bacterium]|nr:DUF4974 domain-containing protein [Cytophagales bacterium]